MLNIALYSQKKDEETLQYLHQFITFLEKKGVKLYCYEPLYRDLSLDKDYSCFTQKHDLELYEVDYFFSFGGDGTILSALCLIQDLEIPIIGVNMGRLGFLAHFSKEEIFEKIDDIFEGNALLSRRAVIEITSENRNIDVPYALNDVTITRKETTSMITVEAEINGDFLSMFWGDGLIVATPSGSTAYSLSCGGPIIEPDNENLTLTPIAPHNLNMRPIILKDNVEIRLSVSSRVPEYSLGLDSRLYHMNVGDTLTIKKASFCLPLIFPKNMSFYDTLRQKLLWGNDKRN